jgi:hypothetical protein
VAWCSPSAVSTSEADMDLGQNYTSDPIVTVPLEQGRLLDVGSLNRLPPIAVTPAHHESAIALIPARNEEGRVASVVRAALGASLVSQTVVVANACSDETAREAEVEGAVVLETSHPGKGEALLAGVQACSPATRFFIFLDADLRELRSNHVDDLLRPVIAGDSQMACGILPSPQPYGRLLQSLVRRHPSLTLTGQRAIDRGVLEDLDSVDASGYQIEVALNSLCKKTDRSVMVLCLDGVHTLRERTKLAYLTGACRR